MGDDFLSSSFHTKRPVDSLRYVNLLVLENFVTDVFKHGIYFNVKSFDDIQ
jgi:hypothetical protein